MRRKRLKKKRRVGAACEACRHVVPRGRCSDEIRNCDARQAKAPVAIGQHSSIVRLPAYGSIGDRALWSYDGAHYDIFVSEHAEGSRNAFGEFRCFSSNPEPCRQAGE